MPLISIIVVTRDRLQELHSCLKSLFEQDYPDYEILVIDSESSDGTEDVQRRYPDIRYYRIPHKGVASARNHGAVYAKGEYVAYIDDDCVAGAGWLRSLYDMLIEKGGDIAGGDSYFADGKTIQYSRFFISRYGEYKAGSEGGDIDRSRYRYVSFNTLNMLIRREVFAAVKFDEYYSYYYEDVDFCVRAQLKGFSAAHAPRAAVVHHESRKGGHRGETDHVFRNTAYFAAKNFGVSAGYAGHVIFSLLRNIKHYYGIGEGEKVKQVLSGTLRGLRDGLKARRSNNMDRV